MQKQIETIAPGGLEFQTSTPQNDRLSTKGMIYYLQALSAITTTPAIVLHLLESDRFVI